MYRPNSDLIVLLSEAMWKLRNIELAKGEETEVHDADIPTTNQLDCINQLILSQIRTFLAKDAQAPFEYDEVNFDNFIKQINPQLWNAICVLTRSASELKGTSKVTDPSSSAYHVKRVHRFFLLCTDDRCSMPLHTLMTDVVESQGGSALLVQILNRLGVCVSADTLSRFIQYKVNTCDQQEMKYLKPDTFTVVSADNIDFMHSFARVFCGHQTTSWHGTTVQAAQPLPSLSLPEVAALNNVNMPSESLCLSGNSSEVGMPFATLHSTVSSSEIYVPSGSPRTPPRLSCRLCPHVHMT